MDWKIRWKKIYNLLERTIGMRDPPEIPDGIFKKEIPTGNLCCDEMKYLFEEKKRRR